MGNNMKVYGELNVHPPLSWKQIRAYQASGGLVRESLRLVIDEEVEETDEGSVVRKTCSVIEVADWENAYGVPGALGLLAKAAPKNEFAGEFTIVRENPEFEENAINPEATRYTISGGQLYSAVPRIDWGPYTEMP